MADKEIIMKRYRHSLIEKLFGEMKYSCSESTYKVYEAPIRNFFFDFLDLEFVTVRDIKEVSTTQVNEWIYQLKQEGNKNATVNRMVSSLYWFYKNLLQRPNPIVDYNPFSTDLGANRLKASTVAKGTRIPDDKLKELNTYFANNRSWLGERNYLMFLIFITTGMRKSEVNNLKIGDFYDYGEKFAVSFVGKGDKYNVAEIPQGIKHILNSFIFRSGWNYTMREQYIFVSDPAINTPLSDRQISYLFDDAYEAVGLPSTVRIHDLRHTYITKSLEMGLDVYDVSKRVGHANINTTRRYDHSFRIFNDNPAEDFFSQLTEKSQQNYPKLTLIKGAI